MLLFGHAQFLSEQPGYLPGGAARTGLELLDGERAAAYTLCKVHLREIEVFTPLL
jgi:hypothetical protein